MNNRIRVNALANVLTGDLSTAYRRAGQSPRPQITVPSLRARFSVSEAQALVHALAEAISVAQREEGRHE